MPAGRPTTYDPAYCERVIEFCAEGYSLTGFAGEIGVGRQSITDWCAAHPEFSLAVARAKAATARWWEDRARAVAHEGGTGAQGTLIVFGLKNHARDDYQDLTKVEHSGEIGLAERLVAARTRALSPPTIEHEALPSAVPDPSDGETDG